MTMLCEEIGKMMKKKNYINPNKAGLLRTNLTSIYFYTLVKQPIRASISL